MMDVVEYSRAAPPEWTTVADIAGMALEQFGQEQPTPAAAAAVLDAVQELDNEMFDSARFYSLGLVMCGLARRLHDPNNRQEIVERAASDILEWRHFEGGYNEAGLCMNDFNKLQISGAFRKYIEDACDALPAGQRLAADTFDVDFGRRAAWTVGLNATAASGSVLRNAMKKLAAAPKEAAGHELFMPTFRAVTAQRGALHSLALRCAALREDEFIGDLQEYIGIDSNGALAFQQARKARAQDLAPPEIIPAFTYDVVVLHRKRLRCPAIFVDGLIPFILDIVCEAIEKAQADIEKI